jgi:glutathione peroxidase
MRFIALALLTAIAAGLATGGSAMAETAHDFQFTSIDGKPMPLSQYKGKALLVVNTASQCGFTPQYTGLERLWQTYQGRGLVVIGVPSNDFGSQEPGAEAEIQTFCETNYNIDFPLTDKQVVKGDKAHPFYRWASTAGEPKWNFHKYLIGPDGKLVAAFGSRVTPDAKELTDALEKVLPAKS